MKKRIMALVVSICMLCVTACGKSSSGDAENKEKDMLDVVISTEPATIDGMEDGYFPEWRNDFGIYEALVTFGEGTERKLQLAEDMNVSDDGLVYTFKLRQGVEFHNGEKLTMDDVQFSYERYRKEALANYVFDCVDNAEFGGDTITFTLKTPYAGFLDVLTNLRIVNRKAVEEGGETYGRNPVGTGPYKFVEWKPSQKILVTRNDNYWGDPAIIKDVNYRIIKEKTSAIASFEKGEVDILLHVPAKEIDRISKMNGVKFESATSNKQLYYFVNTEKVDKNVRQAIDLAIDRDAIIQLVEGGRGRIPTSHIEGRLGDSGKDQGYHRDVEEAKRLLAEAGYEDGYTMTLLHNGSDDLKVSQMIQTSLAEAGINLEIESLESGAFWDRVMASDFQMYGRTANLSLPDSYDFISGFHKDSSVNYVGIDRKDLNDAIDKVTMLPDGEERTEALDTIMDIMNEEDFLIPIYIGETNVAYNSSLKNIKVSGIDFYDLSKVSW